MWLFTYKCSKKIFKHKILKHKKHVLLKDKKTK